MTEEPKEEKSKLKRVARNTNDFDAPLKQHWAGLFSPLAGLKVRVCKGPIQLLGEVPSTSE